MLPLLLNVPKTNRDYSRFSFSNYDSHNQIIVAINQQFGLSLTQYVLDPIPSFNVKSWLLRHQQMHNDFNAVLGTGGSDLSDVDFSNERELTAWTRLHFQEHYFAVGTLRVQAETGAPVRGSLLASISPRHSEWSNQYSHQFG